jgi:hypothetical protein
MRFRGFFCWQNPVVEDHPAGETNFILQQGKSHAHAVLRTDAEDDIGKRVPEVALASKLKCSGSNFVGFGKYCSSHMISLTDIWTSIHLGMVQLVPGIVYSLVHFRSRYVRGKCLIDSCTTMSK